MKISELMAELAKLQAEHGDLEVMVLERDEDRGWQAHVPLWKPTVEACNPLYLEQGQEKGQLIIQLN